MRYWLRLEKVSASDPRVIIANGLSDTCAGLGNPGCGFKSPNAGRDDKLPKGLLPS